MNRRLSAQQIAVYDQMMAGANEELDTLLTALRDQAAEVGTPLAAAGMAMYLTTEISEVAIAGLLVAASVRILAGNDNTPAP
jgi:hypothetical protein